MPHQARALLCTCSKNICHKNSSHLLFFFSERTGCKKNWAKPLRHRHDFEAFGTKSWLLDAICMLFYGQQQFFLIWICDRAGRMDHEYLVYVVLKYTWMQYFASYMTLGKIKNKLKHRWRYNQIGTFLYYSWFIV